MALKSITEMNKAERKRNSLKGKTYRSIIIYSLIISFAAITFGFYLFASAVRRDYRTRTWQMSRTAVKVLDKEEIMREAEEVLNVYVRMSTEEQEQLRDKHSPLLERFSGIRGEGFDEICWELLSIQESNNAKAAFTAIFDLENNRRIFVTDSDPNETFCPPGSLDVMEKRVINDIMNGKQYFLDELFETGPMSSTIFKMEPYGYRCMAGTIVGFIDQYPVFVFFDTDMNRAVRMETIFLVMYIILLAAVTAAIIKLSVRNINTMIVDPINRLSDAALDYIDDANDTSRDEKHFDKLNIQTGDEIENLSLSMKRMEEDLGHYIENLTQVTADRERIRTERTLANRIQAAMMPHIFPPFPDRKEIELYGIMDPAKEVGGDFYDFFLIDDDHLGLVIADVSGKGVPGALFMMISKIIIQSCAMLDKSPAEILTKTNEAICSNNQEEMFVTAWVGILELSTGKLMAANGGHEYPVIKKPGGEFEMMKDRHGLVLGAMNDMKYHEYEIDMEPGSCLFVYTDGVPEATDANEELFGYKRMLAALNSDPDTEPESVLKRVRKGVDDFVLDAEQFDDLTMLCVKYIGTRK
ncbi:MAG: serine/threonine-protein phosphatase [Erysipelotrichaceae bacterium]|nr:serine/threonine-protein phosphatase [Erysipelotrichaceae bacterium]